MTAATRRYFIFSSIICLSSPLIFPRAACARDRKHLVHSVGKAASTIIHGTPAVVHDARARFHDAEQIAKQVETSALPLVETTIQLIGEAIQSAEGVTTPASTVMIEVQNASGAIAAEVGNLASQGLSQAFMLFVNSGLENQAVSYDVLQSAVPIKVSAPEMSVDPFQFVADNATSLINHVLANPYLTVPYNILVPSGAYRVVRVAAQTPSGDGIYPTLISFGGTAALVGLFQA